MTAIDLAVRVLVGAHRAVGAELPASGSTTIAQFGSLAGLMVVGSLLPVDRLRAAWLSSLYSMIGYTYFFTLTHYSTATSAGRSDERRPRERGLARPVQPQEQPRGVRAVRGDH